MSTVQEIEQAIRSLTPEEFAAFRAWFAEFDAEQRRPSLSESQRQELERRIAEDDAAPDDVITWEKVEAQTLARVQNRRRT